MAENQWIEKYRREGPSMLFGSMANAYGQVNKESKKDTKTIKNDMQELYKLACDLVEKRIEKEKESGTSNNDIDLPTE